jgi:hypothetical protein
MRACNMAPVSRIVPTLADYILNRVHKLRWRKKPDHGVTFLLPAAASGGG